MDHFCYTIGGNFPVVNKVVNADDSTACSTAQFQRKKRDSDWGVFSCDDTERYWQPPARTFDTRTATNGGILAEMWHGHSSEINIRVGSRIHPNRENRSFNLVAVAQTRKDMKD